MEHLKKVCICGDAASGKTAFVKRLVHNIFPQFYRETMGVDFALLPSLSSPTKGSKAKKNGDQSYRLQLWDIGASELQKNITALHYDNSAGIFLFFDATKPDSVDKLEVWKADIDCKVGCPVILLVSKIDLVDSIPIDFTAYCNNNGYYAWVAISAKDNIGLDDACDAMIESLFSSPTKKGWLPEKCGAFSRVEIIKKDIGFDQIEKSSIEFEVVNDFLQIIEKECAADRKVNMLKNLFMKLYFSPAMANALKRIKANRVALCIIVSAHDILIDETYTSTAKIDQIGNLIMNMGKLQAQLG